MQHEFILILDFGGQYNQLIARRVREANIYCEVHSHKMSIEEIRKKNPKGIILTGGPHSVYDENALPYDQKIFSLGVPILGICYGSQLMAHALGGKVAPADVSEYGKTELEIIDETSKLFQDVKKNSIVWMSHTDRIFEAPKNFSVTAKTKACPIAAMECPEKNFYAVQFHPEVVHTEFGKQILNHFVKEVCGCIGDWQMTSFIKKTVDELKQKLGSGLALCALSGGVDSSVAAMLVSKAIGKNLTCVFVDHGLLRKNEGDEVENFFKTLDLNFIRINAQERFYKALQNVTEPERKRKIIGEEFIRVFEEEAKKIGRVDFLVQGTIYPDVIESGLGKAAVIKSHHNVGGLPDFVDFKEIVEPLRLLFKDEVRRVGKELGLPENIVQRQPFPGPGLGIRILGEVTAEKVRIVQEADFIFREEIAKHHLPEKLSLGQYFAALTNMRSVGVMGDKRTYDYAIVLRAVCTNDFMTATAAPLPFEILQIITNRIVNEVQGVNRVLYDCTSKPPATIEME